MPERILDDLQRIALSVQKEFKEERRLLSFREYLTLFATDCVRHSRDASRYLRYMFDHFGRETVARPYENMDFRAFPVEKRGESAILRGLLARHKPSIQRS